MSAARDVNLRRRAARGETLLNIFAVGAVGLFLGVMLGVQLGERTAENPPLIHCAINGALPDAGINPCPPPIGEWVSATWGDLTTIARWNGRRWEFSARVLGNTTTNRPADAWEPRPTPSTPR